MASLAKYAGIFVMLCGAVWTASQGDLTQAIALGGAVLTALGLSVNLGKVEQTTKTVKADTTNIRNNPRASGTPTTPAAALHDRPEIGF